MKKIILLAALALSLTSCIEPDFVIGEMVVVHLDKGGSALGRVVGLNFNMVAVKLCDAGGYVSGSPVYIVKVPYETACPDVP